MGVSLQRASAMKGQPYDEAARGPVVLDDVIATDYHTAGEPFRIVTGGVPDVPGGSVRERREAASRAEIDVIRRLLCHEPRGHADMYGCFLVAPDDEAADLGVLFWHKDGYSTACGHGTIALGAWAVQSGLVDAPDTGSCDVVIDVPSGRVTARVAVQRGAVTGVSFVNVPAYVTARDVDAGGLPVDVAYGGAFYAFVDADRLGLPVAPAATTELIAAGRRIKAALVDSDAARHPTDPRLSGIYGVVIHQRDGAAAERNVTVFADGAVDRSPCGSATSARTALLLARGSLAPGQPWTNTSIVGTRFAARSLQRTEDGWLTEVSGTAFRTGEHRFVLDPHDDVGAGFVLR
jgi:proline racemase